MLKKFESVIRHRNSIGQGQCHWISSALCSHYNKERHVDDVQDIQYLHNLVLHSLQVFAHGIGRTVTRLSEVLLVASLIARPRSPGCITVSQPVAASQEVHRKTCLFSLPRESLVSMSLPDRACSASCPSRARRDARHLARSPVPVVKHPINPFCSRVFGPS